MTSLFVFPGWFDTNPFLNMLYLDARAQGYQLNSTTNLFNFLSEVKKAKPKDVIHIHWTSPIAQDGATEKEAAKNVKAFVKALETAKANQVKIIWTIHNSIPHETKYRDLEISLCQQLSQLADRIHVLADNTANEVSEFYKLPQAKQVKVAHSSYWGIYDQAQSKADARKALSIKTDETAVLFLGLARGYKGIEEAVDQVKDSKAKLALLITSQLSAKDLESLSSNLPKNIRILNPDHYLEAEELAVWLRAADFAAFAFKRILNSGSALLAATFGLPLVMPTLGNLPEVFAKQEFVEFYEPGQDNLGKAIAAMTKKHQKLEAKATAFAKSYQPYDMAKLFTQKLLSN